MSGQTRDQLEEAIAAAVAAGDLADVERLREQWRAASLIERARG